MFTQDYFLQMVSVKGEVSNCKYHPSGHIYFTLKDSASALNCIMFAGDRRGLGFRLTEGQQVIAKGSVSVFERDGRYQLYVKEVTQDGAGALYEKYEQLKRELAEEGMFAPEYKQQIPKYAEQNFSSRPCSTTEQTASGLSPPLSTTRASKKPMSNPSQAICCT